MADPEPIHFAYPQREHQAQRHEIESTVADVLRSGAYILGSSVKSFEHAFCQTTGASHTVAVSSGTDALVCALSALGVAPGDEVVVPAFGFVAAVEAVVRVGALPVFVDIEETTLGPDPQCCKAVCTARTRAMIVMHLFGQAVNLQRLRNATGGLPIVEDAAQAMGTRLGQKQVGTLAEVGTFSFFPAKALGAAGDAGAVVTDDAAVATRARQCRVHGATIAYGWATMGGNYRMDAIQAAILSVKLRVLSARLKRRQLIGQQLCTVMAAHGVKVLAGGSQCEPTFAPFAIRTRKRDQMLERLRGRGIDARVHYPSTLVSSSAFREFAPPNTPYQNAERATQQLLSLPCSPELLDDEVSRLIEVVNATLGEVLGD